VLRISNSEHGNLDGLKVIVVLAYRLSELSSKARRRKGLNQVLDIINSRAAKQGSPREIGSQMPCRVWRVGRGIVKIMKIYSLTAKVNRCVWTQANIEWIVKSVMPRLMAVVERLGVKSKIRLYHGRTRHEVGCQARLCMST